MPNIITYYCLILCLLCGCNPSHDDVVVRVLSPQESLQVHVKGPTEFFWSFGGREYSYATSAALDSLDWNHLAVINHIDSTFYLAFVNSASKPQPYTLLISSTKGWEVISKDEFPMEIAVENNEDLSLVLQGKYTESFANTKQGYLLMYLDYSSVDTSKLTQESLQYLRHNSDINRLYLNELAKRWGPLQSSAEHRPSVDSITSCTWRAFANADNAILARVRIESTEDIQDSVGRANAEVLQVVHYQLDSLLVGQLHPKAHSFFGLPIPVAYNPGR